MDGKVNEQLKTIRRNYIDTLKKLISLEEEIEKTVFYLQNLKKNERQEMYLVYESYLQNLNTLRQDLTSLMNDNLLTIQSFWTSLNRENQSTTYKILSESYKNIIDYVLNCYNPFSWFSSPKDSKK